MKFDALIFDLDGVIADTVAAHNEGWILVGQHVGVPVAPEMLAGFRGRRRGDILRSMIGRDISGDEMDALMRVKGAHYDAFLAQMGPQQILPGVCELIDAGRERGLKLAVASSSFNTRAVLNKLCLTECFDVIADGPAVSRSKPFPDIFIWAAGALNVNPVRAVVFEDSAAGVQAALDAGMTAVGIGNPAIVGAAHVVVPSLDGFDLASL